MEDPCSGKPCQVTFQTTEGEESGDDGADINANEQEYEDELMETSAGHDNAEPEELEEGRRVKLPS